ncbi:hypothetical protein LTR56_022622 [Elasticomyces elasticus]|nr:hypothetical protein LTR56_022622 [Elasticomyces elasticus]KAK4905765.1 hypothetical protein LTR49_024971 [Elasticomyces elasticus]KAK5743227.1 hypothetical protein LTS12_023915 [Elasticomyces elasticus]
MRIQISLGIRWRRGLRERNAKKKHPCIRTLVDRLRLVAPAEFLGDTSDDGLMSAPQLEDRARELFSEIGPTMWPTPDEDTSGTRFTWLTRARDDNLQGLYVTDLTYAEHGAVLLHVLLVATCIFWQRNHDRDRGDSEDDFSLLEELTCLTCSASLTQLSPHGPLRRQATSCSPAQSAGDLNLSSYITPGHAAVSTVRLASRSIPHPAREPQPTNSIRLGHSFETAQSEEYPRPNDNTCADTYQHTATVPTTITHGNMLGTRPTRTSSSHYAPKELATGIRPDNTMAPREAMLPPWELGCYTKDDNYFNDPLLRNTINAIIESIGFENFDPLQMLFDWAYADASSSCRDVLPTDGEYVRRSKGIAACLLRKVMCLVHSRDVEMG